MLVGSWDELSGLALPLRMAVFVEEQGVPAELEQDEQDNDAIHVVLVSPSSQAMATGRLVIQNPDLAKIGRLAVAKSYRGQGLGKIVLQALIDQAKNQGCQEVKLHAQSDAEPFYQSFGFVTQGLPFMEAGIKHVLMMRQV